MPPPEPDDDVCDEVYLDDGPLTDPFCPVFDWLEPTPPIKPRRYR